MLIKNGTLIDPKTKTSKKIDIYIEEDAIKKIEENLSAKPEYTNETTIDADGSLTH